MFEGKARVFRRLIGKFCTVIFAFALSIGAAYADCGTGQVEVGGTCVNGTYNVSYTMNSGINYVNAPTTYTYGVGATIDGVPTRSGYTFAGWCTDSTLETCAMTQTIATDATGDKTFYANWEECNTCDATNATCSFDGVVDNVCTYTTTCDSGYGYIQNDGAYNASCSALSSCLGTTFYDSTLETCVQCPTGYDYDDNDGKSDISQCQKQCAAGTYLDIPKLDGFTNLEYLETDGGQYINTGFKHNSTNIRGEIRIGTKQDSGISKNVNFLGNQTASGGYSLGWAPTEFKLWDQTLKTRLSSNTQTLAKNTVYDLSYEFTPTKRYLTYGGKTFEDTHGGAVVTNRPINLFDNGANESGQYFTGRFYYAKIYENDVLVRYFIPVKRNGTDIVGVYDAVTKQFLENNGTGDFQSGDSVEGSCVNVGKGYYAESSVINYGDFGAKTACPAGTYSNIENGTSLASCLACQGATYSAAGASVCSTCPAGYTYNTTAGKTSVAQCQIHCDAGQYLPSVGLDDYTELEYIQTTGTQYIDTGLKVSTLTNPVMSMTLQYLDTTGGKQSGAFSNNLNYKVGISYSQQFLCQSGGSGTEVTFGPADTNKHTFVLDTQNATCTMDDTTLDLSVGDLANLKANIAVGSVSSQQNRIGNVKIYAVQIISDNTTLRNLIPARRNSDSVVGMYDTINNVFYESAVEGETFVAGPDVDAELCTDVGTGYWAPESVTNYGTLAERTQCDEGKTTTVSNASSASQCVVVAQEYNVTYSCGAGTGTEPSSTTATASSPFTPAANSCSRSGHIFIGWGVSDTQDVVPSGVEFTWEYNEDKTLTAQWSECTACAATNASCELSVVNNACTYTTACNAGYGNMQNGDAYNATCTANTITINWDNAAQSDIDANNAGTATYGGDINTPRAATHIPGKEFIGWLFSIVGGGDDPGD